MAISSPLPSTALSSQPLSVTLALDGLPGPASPAASSGGGDVFDELDEARGEWGVERETTRAGRERSGTRNGEGEDEDPKSTLSSTSSAALPLSADPTFRHALSDSAPLLFPAVHLAEEARREGGLPPWLSEGSARVTGLKVGRVSTRMDARMEQTSQGTSGQLRVAAGCEDGTVWMLAPPPSSSSSSRPNDKPRRRPSRDETLLQPTSPSRPSSSLPSPSRPSSSLPSPSPSPVSPPLSPTYPGSASKRGTVPILSHRRSSASISTLSSISTTTNRKSSVASITYSEVRTHDRPRKASATVGVSTTSAESDPHSHSHDLPPPTSPTSPAPSSPPLTASTTPRTRPLSPSPPSACAPDFSPELPHFVFSSPVASRKEARVGAPPPSTVAGERRRRTHSRAKDSIASGIGLWEEGVVGPLAEQDLEREASGFGERRGTRINGKEEEEEEEEEGLSILSPVLKILAPGWGEVVGLEVVRGGLECAERGEEGDVLVVLRRSGHLSIVSLLDGRAFGSCDAAGKIAGSSIGGAAEFGGFEVVQSAESTAAICYTTSGIAVLVDLQTLVAQEAIEGGIGSGSGSGVIMISEQGAQYLLYASPSSSSSADSASPPNELFLRPFQPRPIVDGNSSVTTSASFAVGEPQSLGALVDVRGELKGLRAGGSRALAWDEQGVVLFTVQKQQLVPLAKLSVSSIVDASFAGDERVVVATREKTVAYELSTEKEEKGLSFKTLVEHPLAGAERLALLPTSSGSSPRTLLVRQLGDGTRSLDLFPVSPPSSGKKLNGDAPLEEKQGVSLYRSTAFGKSLQVTCSKKVDSERLLLGYSSGAITLLPLADLARTAEPPTPQVELNGAITLLDVLDLGVGGAGREVVVAGTASGMAAAWRLPDWELIGQWALFASPVRHYAFISPPSSPSSHLQHTLAFISANSPVALVSLSPSVSPPRVLFTLPGTKSAVERIATREGEIMVLYEQGLARVCDVASRELRRSMGRTTAEGVLQEKGWVTWFSLADKRAAADPSSPTQPILSFDLRSTLDTASRQLPWTAHDSRRKNGNGYDSVENSPDLSRSAPGINGRSKSPPQPQGDPLAFARRLLAGLVPFGIDRGCDELLEQLGVGRAAVQLGSGLPSLDAFAFAAVGSPKTAWTTSPANTAQRLLQIVCLLRLFLNYPETERVASEAIVFFASCLGDSVGSSFQAPSLDVFARYWLDKSSEVQQAARSLFGTYLAALPDHRILALVERWEDELPARQTGPGLLHEKANLALLVVGLVAVERFKLLPASVLKDLSVSITTYLDESSHPIHQSVATELCSRGFHIWQNYVDAMALVRQLFAIAIGRNPATPNDLRGLARMATLHVAGVNTPLFMTTLLFDILNAPTAVARNATLKLLGFMIRKKPLVLYTSLPRVAEAVVKSLDPTVAALRETVHQAATVVLNELVRTFPSIDFHGKSQRLAVGTHEGAAIVFDLKTATRLYVLEGHKRPLTALSWSPDGHRLVTVSLDESKVCVWKVGTGLLSFFGAAGAPPRQGAGGSTTTPFKTWDFHVGDEALMTTAATLEWVVFDWPAERTVRLRIRETALNFGV
ncbi:hypothetical protein JCM5296_001559 [Sporobolomyces johnsonii]